MKYCDLHCDTLTAFDSLSTNDGQVSLPKLYAAGCRLICFAAFVRYDRGNLLQTAIDCGRKLAREIESAGDFACLVRCAKDLDEALIQDKIGALFTIEEGAVIEGDLSNLRKLYDAGARMMTLTWNFANGLGAPNATVEAYALRGEAALYETDDSPLTEFGRAVVHEMNESGMIIDVSHLSDGGFWDVVSLSRKPIVASHSNARAVRAVGRNLSDPMIAALAQSGGVMGLNLCPDFLCGKDDDVLAYAVRHVKHIWQVGGEDVLSLGSDFDGMHPRAPLDDCTEIPLLYRALCDQIPPRVVEKMMWDNFSRVFREVCG